MNAQHPPNLHDGNRRARKHGLPGAADGKRQTAAVSQVITAAAIAARVCSRGAESPCSSCAHRPRGPSAIPNEHFAARVPAQDGGYAPIIPDAVTHHYMTKAGLPPAPQTNPRLTRLIALATQKFVADIAADAYQYSRIRGASNTNNPMGSLGAAAGFPIPGQQAGGQAGGKSWQGKGGAGSAPPGIQRPGYGGGSQGGTQNRTVLTMEDLGMAVG